MNCVTEIIQNIVELSAVMSRPVYRGQADAAWKPESGAVRRLRIAYEKDFPEEKTAIQKLVNKYQKDQLIMQMQVIDGEKMKAIKRLSMLQHFGAATNLLDFTENLLVALLFACKDYTDKDAKIFIIDIGDPLVAKNGRKIKKPFDEEEKAVYYEPEHSLGSRIIAQQSVFIICNPFVPDGHLKNVCIPKKTKEPMNNYLKQLGLSQKTLFTDIPGLAAMNSTSSPLTPFKEFTPEQHRERGNIAYQEGRLEDALEEYKSFQEASPKLLVQPYFLKGDVLASLERFDEAILCYTKAIEIIEGNFHGSNNLGNKTIGNNLSNLSDDNSVKSDDDQNHDDSLNLSILYYNRGNLRAASGDHRRAIDDFESALSVENVRSINEDHKLFCWHVLYNRGNSYFALRKYDKALQDFNESWSNNKNVNAALALGNCEVMVGEFQSAYKYYLTGMIFEAKESTAPCHQNGDQTRQILEMVGNNKPTIFQQENILFVELAHIQDNPHYFPFTGNYGNTGNFFSVSDHGRKGYGGIAGFTVIIQQPSASESIKKHS